MKEVTIVIVPQEYEGANHKNLWESLARVDKIQVLILDISADYIVTTLKKKYYRIIDCKKKLQILGSNIMKYRPLFFIRPELLPSKLDFVTSNILKKQLKRIYHDLDEIVLNFIIYDPKWANILYRLTPYTRIFYYILDEVKLFAHSDEKNKHNVKNDLVACEKSKHIFAMSEEIKKARQEYRSKITVIGNGAVKKPTNQFIRKISGSVGFIGNFRNWIDENLLINLIELHKDLIFGFVGPVEDDMKTFFNHLLNKYNNVTYFGIASKEEVHNYYQMFDVVIIPYKQNRFMRATRPIKIVESVIAGTPVVSIPVSGYSENKYIRFATNEVAFSILINSFINNPIDKNELEYQQFVNQNTWESKAKIINKIIKGNM